MPKLVIERRCGAKYVILFDEADRMLVESFAWRVSFGSRSQTPYAVTNVVVDGKRTTRKMHRLIMGEPDAQVDHRNNNGLDNRRKNLRHACQYLQQLNKKPTRRNKSGIVGVRKAGKRWQAFGGDRRWGTYFRQYCDTKKEAVAARKRWLDKRLKELGA